MGVDIDRRDLHDFTLVDRETGGGCLGKCLTTPADPSAGALGEHE